MTLMRLQLVSGGMQSHCDLERQSARADQHIAILLIPLSKNILVAIYHKLVLEAIIVSPVHVVCTHIAGSGF